MGLCLRRRTGFIRSAAAAGLLFCGGRTWAAAAGLDAEQWFARHTDQVWQPLAAKWDEAKASMASPVENLMLPLAYYENGRMRAVLRAKRAQLMGEEMVFAEDVRVDLLTVDGKPDGCLMAQDCLFDRLSKHGYCRGQVHAVMGTDRLKGLGMYFSIEEQFIKILSECEIRTSRIPSKLGRLS